MSGGASDRTWEEIVTEGLASVRRVRPLVHHVTNEVTAEASANAVLALGGLAMMARDGAEVEGAVDQADAVVLNLGTLTPDRAAAMEKAQRAALRLGRPIVIDPVGAGSIKGRDRFARRLLRGSGWIVIRMNVAELCGVMDVALPRRRGVDAVIDGGDDHPFSALARPPVPAADRETVERRLEPVVELAARCARRHEVTVAVTGEVDVVTDGARVVYVRTGHPWLTRMTGAGCMASSIIGVALGAMHEPARLDSVLESAVAGLCFFGGAARWAAEGLAAQPVPHDPSAGDDGEGQAASGPPPGPGSFRVRLFDALYHLDAPALEARMECWEVSI